MTGHNTNWHELTGFQRDCLKAALRLNRDDGHVSGKDIMRSLEADGMDDLNHGRLYPNLDELVDRDLLDKGSADDRTNDYQPTSDARELVRREMQSWLGVVETDQPLAGAIGQ